LSALFSAKSAYMIGYSWLFGTTMWVTFFAGVIAYRTLPKHQFGALQHRVFPVYFLKSIVLSSGLLGYWAIKHPDIQTNLLDPLVPNVLQAYALATVLLGQGANYFIIGPLTSKTMFKRHKLEKEEGKTYNEPGVSAEMKSLNSKFSQLHAVSSLTNLAVVFALGFHGLWIGNFGI